MGGLGSSRAALLSAAGLVGLPSFLVIRRNSLLCGGFSFWDSARLSALPVFHTLGLSPWLKGQGHPSAEVPFPFRACCPRAPASSQPLLTALISSTAMFREI